MYKAKSAGKIGLCQEAEAKSDGRFGLRQVAEAKSDGRFGLCQVAEAKSDGRFGLRQVAEAKSDGKFGLCQVAEAKSDGRFGLRQEAEAKSDGRFGLIHPTRVYLTILTKKHRKRLSFRPIKRNKHEYLEGNTICCIFAPANIMDMKKSLYLLLLFALALFNTGCRHTVAYPTVLSEADSLCMTAPTEAVALLDSIAPQMQQSSDAVRHYYDLLTIKAKDKAFIKHTSDSLVLDVLQYYRDDTESDLLSEALYYAGRVTSDLGDAPQALEYFQNAVDYTKSLLNSQKSLPHIASESQLLSCIYAQMGYLFLDQYLFDNSIESFTLGYQVDSLYDNRIGIIHHLRDIAQVYQQQKKLEQSLYYYDRAYAEAMDIADTLLWLNVKLHRADLLCELGRADSAHTELCSYLSYSPQLTTAACTIIGRMYSMIGEKDSASYYLRPLLTQGTPEQKDYALVWFAQQELDQSDPEQAIEYLTQQINLQYSKTRDKNTEMVSRSNSMYNYQLQVREKERIAREKLQEEKFFICIVSTFIIAIIISIFQIQRFVRQKRDIQIQKDRLQVILKAQQNEKEDAIANNEARIRELLQKLQSSNEHSETVEKECENLRIINTQAHAHQQMITNFRAGILKSSVYSRLIEQGKNNKAMSSEDFKEAESLFSTLLPSFVERLHCIYPFTEKEWKISLLIKMGIPQHLIAPLMCMSEEGISSARRRMYKKVFNEVGSAKQWDDFISGLS